MFTRVEFCDAIQRTGVDMGCWAACAKSYSTKCVVMENYTKGTGASNWSDIQYMSRARNAIIFFDLPPHVA